MATVVWTMKSGSTFEQAGIPTAEAEQVADDWVKAFRADGNRVTGAVELVATSGIGMRRRTVIASDEVAAVTVQYPESEAPQGGDG